MHVWDSEAQLIYKSKVKATDRSLIKKSSDALFKQLWDLGTIDLLKEF